MSDALMSVNDLHVEFDTYGGVVKAVRGVSFDVHPGQTLAIVGESGCGKSVTVQSLMGLIPMPPGRITQGTATLNGQDILGSKIINGNDIRGDQVSMIFQDPNDLTEPNYEHWQPDRRNTASTPRLQPPRCVQTCRGATGTD